MIPAMVTWGWKDDSLGKTIWYYGKILRRKATFISLEVAPYFYALSENLVPRKKITCWRMRKAA